MYVCKNTLSATLNAAEGEEGFHSKKPYENKMHCHTNWLPIGGGFSSQHSEGYSSILTKRLRQVTPFAA